MFSFRKRHSDNDLEQQAAWQANTANRIEAITEATRLLETFTSTASVPYLEIEGRESMCLFCRHTWHSMAETHADNCPITQARVWLARNENDFETRI